MARALSVSADSLVFEQDERGPNEELLLQFEAISQLPPEELAMVKEVLESLIIKYQSRRWDSARSAAAAAAAKKKDKRERLAAPHGRRHGMPERRSRSSRHRQSPFAASVHAVLRRSAGPTT